MIGLCGPSPEGENSDLYHALNLSKARISRFKEELQATKRELLAIVLSCGGKVESTRDAMYAACDMTNYLFEVERDPRTGNDVVTAEKII